MITLPNPKLFLYLSFIFCVVFFGFWVFLSLNLPSHDYANSYFGSYFLLHQKFNLGIFDPYTFNKMIYDAGFRNIFVSYNPNPPSAAILFTPLSLFSYYPSLFIFNFISGSLFLLSAYRLCRHLQINTAVIFLLLPIVFFTPIRNQILFGQTYFLIFFLLAEGYLRYDRQEKWLGAFLWSLAIFLKIFPVIIFLFLILRKEWKIVATLGIMCLSLGIISIVIQGTETWIYYFTNVLPRSNRGEINSSYMVQYQSAHMLLKYLFVQNKDLNPYPLFDSFFLFKILEITFKSAVLSFCSAIILDRKDLLSFGVLILGSLMISPYGNTYGNLLLLILLISASKYCSKKEFIVIILIITAICNIPIFIFSKLPVLFQFPRLIFYIILIVVLYRIFQPAINWVLFLAFILSQIPFWISQSEEKDKSGSKLVKEQLHGLIFNYGNDNGHLFYNYWANRGSGKFITNIPVKTLTSKQISLHENQIYFQDIKLTNTSDNKKNPALLNDSTIIYLSDKDRGIGFYKLRSIKVTNASQQ